MSNVPTLYDQYGRPAVTPQTERQGVASGVGIVGGFFKPIQLQEPPELANSRIRHETYRVMATTDAYIAETLRLVTLPLLCQARWDIDPSIDVEAGATLTPEQEEAQDLADLIGCNVFGIETEKYGTEYTQRAPFSQFIRECLTSLPHGFSLFHKTAKLVNGKLVYARLHWLEPTSIYRWEIDGNDELIGVWRNYIRPDMMPVTGEFLPVEELFLVVWEGVGAHFEGCPFTRSQFGPWKRKDFIQRCKMIAVQQASVGLPWASYDPNEFGSLGDSEANLSKIEEFLQSSLGSGLGTGYAAIPNKTFKADYLKLDAAALEAFDKLIMHENLGEAHGGSAKSMMLGETPGGSRATAQTQRSTESVVAMALAQIMGEQIQKGFANCKGLIEELTGWHTTSVKHLARVVVSGVDPDDAARNGKTVAAYATAGLVKYRPSLEKVLLEGCEITLPDDEFDTEKHPELLLPPPGAPGGGGAPGTKTDGKALPASKPGRITAEDVRAGRQTELRMGIDRMLRAPVGSIDTSQRAGYGRTPTAFEMKVCALGAISSVLTTGGDQIAAALRRSNAQMIEDLLGRVESGKVTRATLTNLRRTHPAGETEMIASVAVRFIDVAALGRRHANEEIARQSTVAAGLRNGTISRYDVAFQDVSNTPPEETPDMLPAGSKIPTNLARDASIAALIAAAGGLKRLATYLATAEAASAREAGAIAIDAAWSRLISELIIEFNRAGNATDVAGVAKSVETALHGLSQAKSDLVGRQLAEVAYNHGRDMAAKESAAAGESQWVVRSEVLDTRTCTPCQQLDGVYLKIGTREYEEYAPPAQCDGGESCRGFITVISTELATALKLVDQG